MTGREDKKNNDLFFVCSLIEYISRKTTNKRIEKEANQKNRLVSGIVPMSNSNPSRKFARPTIC